MAGDDPADLDAVDDQGFAGVFKLHGNPQHNTEIRLT